MFGRKRKEKDLVSVSIEVRMPLARASHFKDRLKALALDYGDSDPEVTVSTPHERVYAW